MKRRQFLALGAAAAVAPVLPPLPETEALTTESFERAVAALGLKVERGYVFTALMPGLQRLSWYAAMDHTDWGGVLRAPCSLPFGE